MLGVNVVNNQRVEPDSTFFYWNRLQKDFVLSDEQISQLRRYALLLVEWNKKFNLTAITDESAIINHHFYDSLAIMKHIDFKELNGICDVGTGAGFPGLPLKIIFPHLMVVLVEVNSKKRLFLEHIAKELGLDNVIISALDWVNFLRMTDYKVDYVFARASLQLKDLVRMFKPSVAYNNATLVYWASAQWEPQKKESLYFDRQAPYRVDVVRRKYVFFNNKSQLRYT